MAKLVHNWWGAPVVISAILGIVGTSLGAHIYRWELLVWQGVALTMALLAWGYSVLFDPPED